MQLTKEVLNFLRSPDFKEEQRRQLENAHKLEEGLQLFHQKMMAAQGKIWNKFRINIANMIQDSEEKEAIVTDQNLYISDRRLLCKDTNAAETLRTHQERSVTIQNSDLTNFDKLIPHNFIGLILIQAPSDYEECLHNASHSKECRRNPLFGEGAGPSLSKNVPNSLKTINYNCNKNKINWIQLSKL